MNLTRSLAALAGFAGMSFGFWQKDPAWAAVIMGGFLFFGALFGHYLEGRRHDND